MSNTIIKKIEIQHPTANIEVDIGAEAQSITVSRNASGEIITDLDTEIVDSTETLAETLKEEESPFTGATASVNGTKGLVPQPLAGDENKCLFGDATWRESISGSSITITSLEASLNGKQVSISDGTHTKTGTFDSSGICTITGITFVGNLTITSTDGTETATKIVNMPYFGVYATTLSFWAATVNITGSDKLKGALVTVKNSSDVTVGTVTLSSTDATGVFVASEADTYKFNFTYSGTSYSQELAVTEEITYSLSLSVGLDYEQWVTLGGLDPTDYASLSEVFADEVAVRRLMTVHASADYLIEKVTDDVDIIDDFTANDTTMKWIGLRDYVCDGLTAITGVEAKFLASQYWERYLKDHVPVMTSNTAPYGTCGGSGSASGHDLYMAFDGNDSTYSQASAAGTRAVRYEFVNPICVKKVYVNLRTAATSLVVTRDGNHVKTFSNLSEGIHTLDLSDNNEYGLKWELGITNTDTAPALYTIQFYGRALDISVPVMTSNTAPYGEAIKSSENSGSGYQAYKAFDNSTSTKWIASNNTNAWIGYDFGRNTNIKFVYVEHDLNNKRISKYKIQGSDDKNTWVDESGVITANVGTTSVNGKDYDAITMNNSKRYHRLLCTKRGTDAYDVGLVILQFYGVDYSEREFASGSTMKYLYDHGFELEKLDYVTRDNGVAENIGDRLRIYSPGDSSSAHCYTNNVVDLTNYNSLFVKNNRYENGGYSAWIGVNTQKTVTNSPQFVASIQPSNTDAPVTTKLDIQSINQSLYVDIIWVYYYNMAWTKVEVSEAWLE